MGITRYYQVEDKCLLNAIIDHFKKREEIINGANLLAEKHGFKKAGFIQDGIGGIRLAGFKCYYVDYSSREDKALWRKPVKDHTQPKSNKNSELNIEYKLACKEFRLKSEDFDEIVGFNSLSYFPTMPGFNYKKDKNQFIFLMPESCESVKGTKEISNIEYIKLKKD